MSKKEKDKDDIRVYTGVALLGYIVANTIMGRKFMIDKVVDDSISVAEEVVRRLK